MENNSKKLQSASLTAEQAVYSIKKMQVRLQQMRSTEEFQRLYDQTIKLADLRDENETQKLKRQTSAPHHLSDYVAHSSSDITTELLRLYYEAVDSVVKALQRRFGQEDLETLEANESFLLAAVNKETAVINTDTLVEQLAVTSCAKAS